MTGSSRDGRGGRPVEGCICNRERQMLLILVDVKKEHLVNALHERKPVEEICKLYEKANLYRPRVISIDKGVITIEPDT